MTITPGAMGTVGSLQTHLLQISFRGTVIESSGTSKTFQSLFHYVKPSAAAVATKDVFMLQFISTVWTGVWQAACNPLFTSPQCFGRWLDLPYDAYAQCSGTPGNPTQSSSDRLPTIDCVTIDKYTGLGGRSNKGSVHIFGLNESDTNKDDIVSTVLTNWQAVATAMTQALTVSGESLYPCVYRRSASNLYSTPPVFAYTTLATGTRTSGLAAVTVLNVTVGTEKRRKERPSDKNL